MTTKFFFLFKFSTTTKNKISNHLNLYKKLKKIIFKGIFEKTSSVNCNDGTLIKFLLKKL